MRQHPVQHATSNRDDPVFQQQVAQFGYSPTFQLPEDADITPSELAGMYKTWTRERQTNANYLESERTAGEFVDPITPTYIAAADAMIARIKAAAAARGVQLASE